MTLLGVDPGSRKVGVAVLTESGEVPFRAILQPDGLLDEIRPLVERFRIEAVAVGAGTRGAEIMEQLAGLGLPCERVDETGTTLDARKLYFEAYPPRGWRRLVPRGMLTPPRPIDDFAAELIARRLNRKLREDSER
ncbi:MAG: pre-16S rRNA-processing nuclease YqgF [Candidatus Eremiobacteraeota bacterium]|nr:pre-16S rRNA-processing nuclease YqgF [Candidatus Eremiobacteraeota bacterium]NNM92127.1 pre-16S rRNA-processing nuclease YqgF [Candidatus Eremiobacteraeota bacterium]